MWPFKKKELIRDKWLTDNGINTKYADAFRYSKSQLRDHIKEQEQQRAMWNGQLEELHVQKKLKDRKMQRLTDEANAEGITEQAENDIIAQQSELEKQFLQDSKRTRDAMASLREAEKTLWLLNNILEGTFTDPVRMSEPPQEGWGGDWDELFFGIPDVGRMDPELKAEKRAKYGIKRKDHDEDSADETEAPNDSVDPFI